MGSLLRSASRLAAAFLFTMNAAAQTAAAPPAPPPATLAQVAWLQGYWDGEGLGGTVEDLWMPARAGVMLGAFRLVKPAGTPGSFYQLFAIEEVGASLAFVFRHFNPDLTAWEEKDKVFRIPLTAITADTATFGGVAFRRDGDVLEVQLRRRGADGTSKTDTMRMKRRAL